MKNMKFWRTALVATLVLTVMLSVTGGTIAWFTDEVTSSQNVIESGTLKVDLELKNDNGGWDSLKTSNAKIFDYQRWEPGFTQVEYVKVQNEGNLAFKYQIKVIPNTPAGEGVNLADVIDVYYAEDATAASLSDVVNTWTKVGTLTDMMNVEETAVHGVMLPGQSDVEVGIALHMQESAGNEYQNLSVGDGFSIELRATQYTHEKDSFGIDYDAEALYPVAVSDAAELLAAVAAGGSVVLENDISLTNENVIVPVGVASSINLNGKTLSVKNTEAKASKAIENKGTLTLKNGTVTYEGVGDPSFGYGTNTINNTGKLVIDGATIINTTTSGSSVAIDNTAGAELIVNNGVIKSNKNAIRLCPFGSAPINATINGGTITGARAIQIQLPSNKPNEAPDINLTVNGGSLASNAEEGFAVYSYSAGQSFKNVDITLNGGTYIGYVGFTGGAKDTKEKITVNADKCVFTSDVFSYADAEDEYIAVPNAEAARTADELVDALKSGGTIVLADDVNMGETEMTVGAGTNVTIDLAGNELTGAYTGTDHYAMFTIANGASLTINGDGEVKANTQAAENNRSLALFYNAGELTINGGTYNVTDASEGKTWIIATIVDNRTNNLNCNAKLTINGGDFSVGGNAINLFRNYPQQGGTAKIVINDGTFHAKNGATTYIWNQESGSYVGELWFNGGTYDANVVYEDYNGQSDIHIADGVTIQGYSGNN